jgi:phospholipase C
MRFSPGLVAVWLAACSSPAHNDAGIPDASTTIPDASTTTSRIEHVVIIVQENHTFDAYFGRYCTAAAGSNPTCTSGPACCEAAPDHEPGTTMAAPMTLDDAQNGSYDPLHASGCEALEINDGGMDRFATGSGCSDPRNFAVAPASAVQPYWDLASLGALADRYFQPVIGASSSNDMYFARAAYVFLDNAYAPNSVGKNCPPYPTHDYTELTLGDLLNDAGVPWAFYAEGYGAMAAADGGCPPPAAGCPAGTDVYPCVYSGGDVPFQYYPRLRENPANMRDYSQLAVDLDAGTLPAVVFVKAIGYRSEHPGSGTTISAGTGFVSEVLATLGSSSAATATLTLLAYDESGGFFDHVTPPPVNPADHRPYGPRVPLIAIGPFARAGAVSHVTMEHSSIVRFIEWNWLGGVTGQLGTRDGNVANIGSLLDPAATGVPVPVN